MLYKPRGILSVGKNQCEHRNTLILRAVLYCSPIAPFLHLAKRCQDFRLVLKLVCIRKEMFQNPTRAESGWK